MKRPTGYNTKQREAVLGYIVSLGDTHVTAAQIVEYFAKENVAIGRTTIYRHLDKLVESGQLRRYTTDRISGACYQYVGGKESCNTHLHLKCEGCGKLLHLKCDELDKIQRHVFNKHAFKVNTLKTVLYGECDTCLRKA